MSHSLIAPNQDTSTFILCHCALQGISTLNSLGTASGSVCKLSTRATAWLMSCGRCFCTQFFIAWGRMFRNCSNTRASRIGYLSWSLASATESIIHEACWQPLAVQVLDCSRSSGTAAEHFPEDGCWFVSYHSYSGLSCLA